MSLSISLLIFKNYEYEIDEFNTKVRSFVMHQKFVLREFDSEGIPHSYSASQGYYISPYYVAHYGLRYSESILNDVRNKDKKIVWYDDPTQKYWNVDAPDNLINEKSFKASVDWLVNNIGEVNGYSHLIYNFKWKYDKLPIGELRPNWWSGLTDSLAMNLMLRAYIHFDDEQYKIIADKLYTSLRADVHKGGSFDIENKYIIEYASQEIKKGEFAYVLNGAYYAYLNILSYESYFEVSNPIAQVLERELINSIDLYFADGFSYYDRIKNIANIKYDNINFAIARELKSKCRERNPGQCVHISDNRTWLPYTFYAVMNGHYKWLVFHLLFDYLLLTVLLYFTLIFIFNRRKINKSKNNETK